MSDFLEALMV